MIASNSISVLVQGPVDIQETRKCLVSIRRYLPDAEIILSTWNNDAVSDLDYDDIVLCDDPGAVLIEEFKNKQVYNNINRQLYSTKEGLKRVSRQYAMKLRSDLILTNNTFLDYFEKFQSRGTNYNVFERKILTDVLFTRFSIKSGKQYKRVEIPFHISDWWLFGLTDDLKKYFIDTELVIEPHFTNYFSYPENINKLTPYGRAKFKFAPEQYFGYSCFSRNFDDIYMEDAADVSDDLIEKSRQCLVNNFIFLEFAQSGIYLNKYSYSKNERFSGDQYLGLYNFYRYECEYKKYCDRDYTITTKDKFFKNERLAYAILKLNKHLYKLQDKFEPFNVRLEQIFIGIPFSIINFIICFFNEKLRSKHK